MFAGFGTADETNERFRYLLEQGQTGLSTAFDMPTLMGYDSDARARARRGRARGRRDRHARRHGGSLRRHPARRGHRVDDGQRARGDGARDVRLHGAPPRHSADALGGTIQTDILKEFIAQKEWIFPPEPSRAARRRHDRVVLRRDAALAPGLDQRVPHPRGRGDRRAGARVHARRRLRLRARLHRARPARRPLRAPAVVLLQRAPRLLRGDREVPRGAPDLGARAARARSARRRSARC